MSKKTETGQKGSSYLARRKRLARQARVQYPSRLIGWVGGVLYFLDSREPVSRVEHVSKDGGHAEGWAAGNPAPKPNEQRSHGYHSVRNTSSHLGRVSSPPPAPRRSLWSEENWRY